MRRSPGEQELLRQSQRRLFGRVRLGREGVLAVAQLGYAQWFFGNLYEAVVRVPERIAAQSDSGELRLTSVIGSGSPVRYFLPGLPIMVGATVPTVVNGWRSRKNRAWLRSRA